MNKEDIGNVVHVPSKKVIADVLEQKNSLLAGTGFKYIHCEGQIIESNTSPLLTTILGTNSQGKIQIPDMRGVLQVGAGTGVDKNNASATFGSGVKHSDGEYSHKLIQDEMTHFHVLGAFDVTYTDFILVSNDSANRDLSGCNDLDSFLVTQMDSRRIVPVVSIEKTFGERLAENTFITTKNDNDSSILTQRNAHNNIQPAIGGYFLMFIDDTSNT